MAVEAVLQEVRDRQPIAALRFVDVYFLKALMSVSSAEDFEMQLCLEPSRTDLDKSTSRYMFSIRTHENGEWSNNCRGTVVTEYEEDAEVDHGKERRAEVGLSEVLYILFKSQRAPPEGAYRGNDSPPQFETSRESAECKTWITDTMETVETLKLLGFFIKSV